MFFKFAPFLGSLVFAAILEVLIFWEKFLLVGLVLMGSFLLFSVWPLVRKTRFLLSAGLLAAGSALLLFLIDSFYEQQIFVAFSAVIFYLLLLGGYRLRLYPRDQTAQGMINLATLAVAFFCYAALFGWYLNLPELTQWQAVAFFALVTFLLSWPSFLVWEDDYRAIFLDQKRIAMAGLESEKERVEGEEQISKKVFLTPHRMANYQILLFFGFLLALLMGEIAWGLFLWPFNYLTTGVVALVTFFAFWDSARMLIKGELSFRMVALNICLVLLSMGGLLVSTNWGLVN
jgi:hypothetical protein